MISVRLTSAGFEELGLPSDRIEYDSSRVDKFIAEQRLVMTSIQTRHFNPVRARVRPVHVLTDPVHGHALRRPKSYIYDDAKLQTNASISVSSPATRMD